MMSRQVDSKGQVVHIVTSDQSVIFKKYEVVVVNLSICAHFPTGGKTELTPGEYLRSFNFDVSNRDVLVYDTIRNDDGLFCMSSITECFPV